MTNTDFSFVLCETWFVLRIPYSVARHATRNTQLLCIEKANLNQYKSLYETF